MALLQFTNLNKYGNKRSRIVHRPTTQIGINPLGFGSYVHVNVFKYEYKHPVLAPTLLKMDGKTYLMPEWREVHPETTLNDIIWKKPKVKKKDKFEKKTWKFESSSSDSVYTVTQVDSATINCNCPGFYRAKDRNLGCKHVQKVRASLTK
jgi:hypothetical protein